MAFDVLLVDDHKIMRDGIKAILSRADDFRVSGEAENGADAVHFVKQHKPAMVLLDIGLPDGLNGVETTTEILRAENLVKRFGEREVVQNVSLTVRAGEVVALMGRNGVGKTTLLRMLLGELTPDAGRVRRALEDRAARVVHGEGVHESPHRGLPRRAVTPRFGRGVGGQCGRLTFLEKRARSHGPHLERRQLTDPS